MRGQNGASLFHHHGRLQTHLNRDPNQNDMLHDRVRKVHHLYHPPIEQMSTAILCQIGADSSSDTSLRLIGYLAIFVLAQGLLLLRLDLHLDSLRNQETLAILLHDISCFVPAIDCILIVLSSRLFMSLFSNFTSVSRQVLRASRYLSSYAFPASPKS